MARTTAKKASPKKVAPKKAVKKPVKAPVRKAARSAPKGNLSAVRKAEIHHLVDRPHKGEHHDEQIKPLPVEGYVPPPPADHLHGNYGEGKARGVPRQDNPTNWFRQAPKPKSK